MKIGLISDTHGYLDPRVFDYFQQVDEIWHAGDIGTVNVLEALELFKPTRAVFGNVDGQSIRIRTKEDQLFICQDHKVLITHIASTPPRYNRRVRDLIRAQHPRILICGHSHFLRVERDKDHGLLFINPGAAGRHGFHKVKTVVRFDILPSGPTNLEVIELGKRGEPA